MSDHPIAQYALLSDCRGSALVHQCGSIDWLCLPRFDSSALFARLLDPDAGHWSITPAAPFEVERQYVAQTMVLETTFRTATGTARLRDALAVGRNERGHELGSGAPATVVREVTGVDGEVVFDVEYSPRPEYGLVLPLLQALDGGVRTRGGPDQLCLSTRVPFTIDGGDAHATFRVRAGERVRFALQHRTTSEAQPLPWPDDDVTARLDDTVEAWRTWSEMHQNYDGPWHDLVHHSGRVLYALTYYPTGAICAAPTTSLPEAIGGTRNWDYRYAWVRDASLTMRALWVAACPDEAKTFFEFMGSAAAGQVRADVDLHVVFGLGGEHDLSERELPHLRGWRDSAPVRVGNDAWRQRQVDIYGELLDAAHRLPEQLDQADELTRRFFADLADVAAARWQEPDQGIWEFRGEPQHYLHSKLMCWVALDRAVALADRLDARDRVDRWKHERDAIADAILSRGWNEEVGAFTQAFGSDALDASALMIPIVGFLDGTDPRVRATVAAIEEHLTDEHGLVYRYRVDDGIDGAEGTFLLCTFWLAEALACAGAVEHATEVFERAIAFVNDVCLLSEEVDPATGELLGNFPQAFSHIGLVNAAWAISRAARPSAEGEGRTRR
jgi:GH15 family glucan-1,4-alpha-glucosidase